MITTKKVVLQPDETVTGYHLKTVQDNTEQGINQLANLALVQGNFVSMALVAGDNTLLHGLNRDYQGFIVTLRDANQNVWLSSTVNTRKNRVLILQSSGTVNATIYIF
jgi:hypothetical protein